MFFKHLPKRLACLVALFLALGSVTSYAQSPTPRTLLWRISGNGLTKPSYVFGTIHLSDKRLFNFGDSLYRAIERTDGLAIELNPDEMIAYYINEAFEKLQSEPDNYRDEVDERMDELREALARKLQRPARSISRRDLVREKHRWMTDYMTRNEMPTFVDAYLYNIARRQGKWVGGIEDLADQTGLLSDLLDETDVDLLADRPVANGASMVEQMIRLYIAQDMDGIEALVTRSGMSSRMQTLAINRRNLKMARRMDSLAAQRSMFFAVGAAHLPGDSGVVQLLRQRGFTATPVMSSAQKPAAQYTFPEVPTPWYDIADTLHGYTAKMPGNPTGFRLYGVVDIRFLFDIFNMTAYSTMAVISTERQRSDGELLDKIAAQMFRTSVAPPHKTLTQNGIRGREYTSTYSSHPARVRLFVRDGIVYVAMAYAQKKPSLTSADAERFFSSFTISAATPVLARGAALQTFSDTRSAMRMTSRALLLPYKLQLDKESAEAYDMRCWAGVDGKTGVYIMLVDQSTREGFHIENDSSALVENYEALATAYKRMRSRPVRFADRSALSVTGRTDEAHMRGMIFMRGNRRYLVMALAGDSTALRGDVVDDLFSGFELLPYAATTRSTREAPDATFATTAPGVFRSVPATEAGQTQSYTTFDTNTTTTYYVKVDTLDAYTWYASDSAAWALYFHTMVPETGTTTLWTRSTKAGIHDSREWMVQLAGSDTRNRVRVVRHGTLVYTLFASGDAEALESETSQRFFADFKALTPATRHDWLAPRLDALLAAATDTARGFGAQTALRGASFSEKDLPALHAAFLRNYASAPMPGAQTDPEEINEILGAHLATLAHPSTLRLLEEKWPRFTAARRSTAASVLARTRTAEAYRTLGRLLVAHPLQQRSWALSFYLVDSLPLTRTIYPQLLRLAADSTMGPVAANAVLTLLDSGLISRADVRDAEAGFIRGAESMEARLRADSNRAEPYAHSVLRLLGRYATPRSLAALARFNDLPAHRYLSMAAVVEGLRAGAPADTAALAAVAADPMLRLFLYNNLKDAGHAGAFPARYATQPHIAEALVYEQIDEMDDEALISLKPLGTRMGQTADGPRRFYIYRATVTDGQDTTARFAAAGGFEKGTDAQARTTPLTEADNWSGIYYEDRYRPGREEEQLAALLRQVAEYRRSWEEED